MFRKKTDKDQSKDSDIPRIPPSIKKFKSSYKPEDHLKIFRELSQEKKEIKRLNLLKDKEIKNLKAENQNLHEQNTALSNRLSEFEPQINEIINLQTESSNLKQKSESLQTENVKLKLELEKTKNELKETNMEKERYKEDSENWILHLKKVELRDLKFLTKETYRAQLSKTLTEIKEWKKQFDAEKFSNEPKQKSPLSIQNNQEDKSAKQFIIELLTANESLEERQIIETLQQQGIPEGTVRKALDRERDKLFKKNIEGQWILRQ